MNQFKARIKPKKGFSHLLHVGFLSLLPIVILILVRADFVPLAVSLVLLSKWRMFAVRPRHWPANIRANAVDITVGLAIVIFIAYSESSMWQLLWVFAYGAWLIRLKPKSSLLATSVQALIGQLAGLMALYLAWGDRALIVLVFMTGIICYFSARHFFTSFEESHTRLLAWVWGYFGAAMAWILGHWLLFYGVVAQPTILLSVIGYGLAALYYLEHHERLSTLLRRQFVFIMIAIIMVVLAFSDWSDKTI